MLIHEETDFMKASVNIAIVDANELNAGQKAEILRLQRECFPDVTAEEVEEDFCRPPMACVLAHSRGVLVACAEVFVRKVTYEGHAIMVGGFSPCAREDVRGQGVGTAVCRAAMDYLRGRGCAVAFLSVDMQSDSFPLYERLGFKMLAKPFVYANARGELKEGDGGMVAPLCAPEMSERILRGDELLSLGPEAGYW